MPSRKIRETSSVNELTGEITYHRSLYADRYTESFIMIRTTEGKDWFFSLSNNEKNLLLMLWDWSSAEDMSVYLGSVRRDKVCMKLSIKRRQITSIIGSLCEKGYIKRVGRDDFLVNPEFCFKCSVGKVREKIEKYKKYAVKHKNESFYSE